VAPPAAAGAVVGRDDGGLPAPPSPSPSPAPSPPAASPVSSPSSPSPSPIRSLMRASSSSVRRAEVAYLPAAAMLRVRKSRRPPAPTAVAPPTDAPSSTTLGSPVTTERGGEGMSMGRASARAASDVGRHTTPGGGGSGGGINPAAKSPPAGGVVKGGLATAGPGAAVAAAMAVVMPCGATARGGRPANPPPTHAPVTRRSTGAEVSTSTAAPAPTPPSRRRNDVTLPATLPAPPAGRLRNAPGADATDMASPQSASLGVQLLLLPAAPPPPVRRSTSPSTSTPSPRLARARRAIRACS